MSGVWVVMLLLYYCGDGAFCACVGISISLAYGCRCHVSNNFGSIHSIDFKKVYQCPVLWFLVAGQTSRVSRVESFQQGRPGGWLLLFVVAMGARLSLSGPVWSGGKVCRPHTHFSVVKLSQEHKKS